MQGSFPLFQGYPKIVEQALNTIVPVSNNDLSAEVKKQAREMESIKTELTSCMDKFEALVQQQVGTMEGLRSDIQGLKKGKHVQDKESSQLESFFYYHKEPLDHKTPPVKQHGETDRKSSI